jgi:hypothetical protein
LIFTTEAQRHGEEEFIGKTGKQEKIEKGNSR